MKEEEYHWFIKQQEILRYSENKTFSFIDKKRKNNQISQELSPTTKSQETQCKNSPYLENGKLKKMKSSPKPEQKKINCTKKSTKKNYYHFNE